MDRLNEHELLAKLQELRGQPEKEWLEFKSMDSAEASDQKKEKAWFNDKLGPRLASVSNEALLNGVKCGWVVIGVSDDIDHKVVGTDFRKADDQFERLPRDIANGTNGLTTSSYQVICDNRRVVLIQVHPAAGDNPTDWKGEFYWRNGSHQFGEKDEPNKFKREEFSKRRLRQRLASGCEKFEPFLNAKRKNFEDRPWLFDEVDGWAVEDQPLLLIVGNHGTGKSAFLAEFIFRNPNERILAYHCCQWDVPGTLQGPQFVLNLAGMFCERLGGYWESLSDPEFAKVTALIDGNASVDPASVLEAAILVPLARIARESSEIGYIVLDGLDESVGTTAPSSPTIIDLLRSRLERLPGWLRIIATTQPEPGVMQALAGGRQLRIDDQGDERVVDDVQRWLKRRFENDPNLTQSLVHGRISADDAADQLVKRCGPRFRNLGYALEGLRTGDYSLKRVDEIPPSLEGFYAAFLSRQFPTPESFADAKSILEVLVVSQEPASRGFLAAATTLDDYRLNSVMEKLARYVQRRGTGQNEAYYIEDSLLAEWLVDPDKARSFFVSAPTGHNRLGELCGQWTSQNNHQFRNYALQFEATHAAKSGAVGARRLLETPWFFHRLISLSDGYGTHNLLSDLALLASYLPELKSLLEFVTAWVRALEDKDRPVAAWLKEIEKATGLGLPPLDLPGDKIQLLRPILGPTVNDCGYAVQRQTSQFQGTACAIRNGGEDTLVLVEDRGDLSSAIQAYHRTEEGFSRQAFPPLADYCFVRSVASCLSGSFIALARKRDVPMTMRIRLYDRFGKSRMIIEDDRIMAAAVVEGSQERIVIVRKLQRDDGWAYDVAFLTVDGDEVASIVLPFDRNPFYYGSVEVLAVGADAVGVVWPTPNALLVFRLDRREIIQIASIENVSGASPLPDGRVAITRYEEYGKDSELVIARREGDEIVFDLKIPLYRLRDDEWASSNVEPDEVLTTCRPVAFNSALGVLLGQSNSDTYSVELRPDATPTRLPRSLRQRLFNREDETCSGIHSLHDGSTLFVFRNCALVLDEDASQIVALCEDLEYDESLALMGCTGDSEVISRSVDSWNDEMYVATPPFATAGDPDSKALNKGIAPCIVNRIETEQRYGDRLLPDPSIHCPAISFNFIAGRPISLRLLSKRRILFFPSGRIEVRERGSSGQVIAVGYTEKPATAAVISNRREGRFLVVQADHLHWFDINQF